MGLDISHDCFHGGYGLFMTWRVALCRAAGWGNLYAAPGYNEMFPGFPHPFTKDGPFTPPDTGGHDWPRDYLTLILNHSDCDGSIESRACAGLADRLYDLLPALALEDAAYIREGRELVGGVGLVTLTDRFVRGLRAAAAAGEDVEFY